MPPSIRQVNYQGWEALELKNELVSLVAVPAIGGRVMAYQLGPYSYLYNDPNLLGKLFSPQENQGDGSLAAWKNYGGDKTWPSPQGWDNLDQWPGPPDPILDTGRYTAETGSAGERAWVRLTSPAGSTTGIQITRQFSLRPGSTRVEAELTFHNISARSVRWSIWDVLQLDASRRLPDGRLAYEPACAVTARLNPHSRIPNGYYVMFGEASNPQWTVDRARGLFVGRYRWEIGKVGIDCPAGWVAFSNAARGYAFAERFAYDPQAEYPDGGVSIECWTVGRGKVANLDYAGSDIYLMESEVLSPYHTFAPGEKRSFTIQWGACCCPGLVVDVSPAGCVVEPLSVERLEGSYARLKGSFGAFDRGTLHLSWLDAAGAVISASDEGTADPLSAILLDSTRPVPERAAAAMLEVKSSGSGETGLLARAGL